MNLKASLHLTAPLLCMARPPYDGGHRGAQGAADARENT